MRTLLFSVVLALAVTSPGLQGQDGGSRRGLARSPVAPADSYLDATAAALHASAMANWRYVDETVVRYTALVKQRLAAALRTPLKDRTIFRSEAATRVFWNRDGISFVQVIGQRQQHPGGVEVGDLGAPVDGMFDPAGDRLFFGMTRSEELGEEGEDDMWFHHPLAADAGEHYRFQTGDTVTLTFPDGRIFRTVELQVLPRVADAHRISGSLWIEPESGALARAAYRLADHFDAARDLADEEDFEEVPGIFLPITFDLSLVVVDYTLWDFEVWLPRSLRMEGQVQAGFLRAPGTLEVSYRMESVRTEADLAREAAGEVPADVVEQRRFKTRSEAMAYLAELIGEEAATEYQTVGAGTHRYLAPVDRSLLLESPELPPPVWDDAAGFVDEDDVRELEEILADLPQAAPPGTYWAANWGLERPDLVRYNRVEGPSVGARLQLRTGSPFGPVSLDLVPFLGLADLEPKVRGEAAWENLKRKVTVGGYRELRSAVRRGRHLGLGNSATALLFGRDDGEYFLATGGDLVVTPPTAERESWKVRLYGERHHAVATKTDFNVANAFEDGWRFRENIAAVPHDEIGGELVVSPWWGTDPLAPQAGMELYVQGALGGLDYSRTSLLLRGVLPFGVSGTRWRAALEAEGGESWGDVPLQRNWFLGSASTLRGYDASTLVGPSFARLRGEVGRAFPSLTVSLFSDAGWTGEGLDAFDTDDALVSVGVGASILEGLIRLDVARGLRAPEQTRWDFYLDAAF